MSSFTISKEIPSSNFRPAIDSFEPAHLFVILHGSGLFVTTFGLFVPTPAQDIFFRDYEVLPVLRMLHGEGHHCWAVRVTHRDIHRNWQVACD